MFFSTLLYKYKVWCVNNNNNNNTQSLNRAVQTIWVTICHWTGDVTWGQWPYSTIRRNSSSNSSNTNIIMIIATATTVIKLIRRVSYQPTQQQTLFGLVWFIQLKIFSSTGYQPNSQPTIRPQYKQHSIARLVTYNWLTDGRLTRRSFYIFTQCISLHLMWSFISGFYFHLFSFVVIFQVFSIWEICLSTLRFWPHS